MYSDNSIPEADAQQNGGVRLDASQLAALRSDLNAIRRVLEDMRDQQAELAEALAGVRLIRVAGGRKR